MTYLLQLEIVGFVDASVSTFAYSLENLKPFVDGVLFEPIIWEGGWLVIIIKLLINVSESMLVEKGVIIHAIVITMSCCSGRRYLSLEHFRVRTRLIINIYMKSKNITAMKTLLFKMNIGNSESINSLYTLNLSSTTI